MSDPWGDLTIGQAIVILAATLALLWAINHSIDAVRRRRGLPPLGGWQHCEHCAAVDGVRDQLDALITHAHDRLAVTEEIRDNTRRAAATLDELAADEKPVAYR